MDLGTSISLASLPCCTGVCCAPQKLDRASDLARQLGAGNWALATGRWAELVLVMKAAKDWCDHDPHVFWQLMAIRRQRDLPMWRHGYAGAKTRMRPAAVVMLDPLFKDPPRMIFAEWDHVVETLPTYCSD